jgi:hypothetical protein
MSYLGADSVWHDAGFYLFQAELLKKGLFNFLIIRASDFFQPSEYRKMKKMLTRFLQLAAVETRVRICNDYTFIFRKDWYLKNTAKIKLVLRQSSYILMLILMGIPLPIVAAFDLSQVHKVVIVPWNRNFKSRSLLTLYTRNLKDLEKWLDSCQEVLSCSAELRNSYSLVLMNPDEFSNHLKEQEATRTLQKYEA